MSELSVFLLIVIYNKGITTLKDELQLCLNDGFSVLVFDNSTEDFNNRAYCDEHGIVYFGGNGNLGLSKAYNQAVDYCLSQTDDGVICFFDDDTEITAPYLAAVKRSYTGEKAVYAPILSSGEKVISPAILKNNFRCGFFKSKEAALIYRGHNLTALNSGLAVDLKVFDGYRYDERLFLDGIDHKFMIDMAKKDVPIQIMDCTLEHHLSAYEKPSLDSALHRYRIYKDDVKIFAGDKYKKILLRHTLKLTLQYKTCAFLKKFRSDQRGSPW